jgi:hypothetical protein
VVGGGRGVGCQGEEQPLFLPPPSFMVCRRVVGVSLFFPLSFLCDLLGAISIFWGQAWAEGKGDLAACRLVRTADGNRA